MAGGTKVSFLQSLLSDCSVAVSACLKCKNYTDANSKHESLCRYEGALSSESLVLKQHTISQTVVFCLILDADVME